MWNRNDRISDRQRFFYAELFKTQDKVICFRTGRPIAECVLCFLDDEFCSLEGPENINNQEPASPEFPHQLINAPRHPIISFQKQKKFERPDRWNRSANEGEDVFGNRSVWCQYSGRLQLSSWHTDRLGRAARGSPIRTRVERSRLQVLHAQPESYVAFISAVNLRVMLPI